MVGWIELLDDRILPFVETLSLLLGLEELVERSADDEFLDNETDRGRWRGGNLATRFCFYFLIIGSF